MFVNGFNKNSSRSYFAQASVFKNMIDQLSEAILVNEKTGLPRFVISSRLFLLFAKRSFQ